MSVGKQLSNCRKLANLNQIELGDLIGVTQSEVSKYERDLIDIPVNRFTDLINLFTTSGVPENEINLLRKSQDPSWKPIESEISVVASESTKELNSNPLLKKRIEKIMLDEFQLISRLASCNSDLIRGGDHNWSSAADGASKLISDVSSNNGNLEKIITIGALEIRSKANFYLTKVKEAIADIKNALEISKSMEDSWQIKASLLSTQGNFYRRLSNWPLAENSYVESRELYKKFEHESGVKQNNVIGIVERKIAGNLNFQGKPKEALQHCFDSLKLFEESEDESIEMEVIKSEQHKAWSFAMLGNWDEALDLHLQQVAKINKLDGNFALDKSKAKRYLAEVYRMCGFYDLAVQWFDEALTDLESYQDFSFTKEQLIRGTIILGKATALIAMSKKNQEEYKLLTQSLEIHNSIGSKLHVGMTYVQFAQYYLKRENPKEAIKSLNKAKTIFTNLTNSYYQASVELNLAKAHLMLAKIPEARGSAKNALDISKKHFLIVLKSRSKLLLSKIETSDGENKKAFTYFFESFKEAVTINRYLVFQFLLNATNQNIDLDSPESLVDQLKDVCSTVLTDKQLKKEFQAVHFSIFSSEIKEYIDNIKASDEIPLFENSYLLTIGINTYENFRQLTQASKDAKDLKELLVSNGYENKHTKLISDISNPNKEKVTNGIRWLGKKATYKDAVILFFSGHGMQVENGSNDEEYLCVKDSDPTDPDKTAISSELLRDLLNEITAKVTIVILDACHSGGYSLRKGETSKVKSGLTEKTYKKLRDAGKVIISSSGPNEFSYEDPEKENSLFTHFLLQGINGKVPSVSGYIEVYPLWKFIRQEVSREKPDQNPNLYFEASRIIPAIRVNHSQ